MYASCNLAFVHVGSSPTLRLGSSPCDRKDGFCGQFPLKLIIFVSLPSGLEKGSGLPKVSPVRSCITVNKTRTATCHVKTNSLELVMNGSMGNATKRTRFLQARPE